MDRKRSPLVVQILLFLLVTLLGVATGNVTNSTGALPYGLELLRRQSLPLAGLTVLVIIGVMVWQHQADQRPARPVWNSDRSPFPGLEAFTEQDSAVFFGRDAETATLLDRLHPVVAARANRLIAVVGPSGAGKSSLVQAGVVPRLRQRRDGWIVVPPVIPGDHPLRSLARSLAAAGCGHLTDEALVPRFANQLRAVQGRPNAPVLLIIDQAEELITLSGRTECHAFLSRLAGELDDDSKLWVIVIMRSEFLTAFLGTEQARLFADPVTVGALGREALVEVIEQPARRAGLSFDPPTLPQRMATDAGGGDALPLLAYALQEFFLAAGSGKRLTADSYQRLGGVTGVLTRQADKVSAELGGADGPVLSTLLKFVTIGENEPTRRRVPRGELTDAQWRVAEAFIAARLLTSDGDGGDAILQVAHEALFRSWAPLRQAIEASADQLRWRADLERWARDWEDSGRRDAYLLRDERLKAAQRWAASDGEVLVGLPLVTEFLNCSNRSDQATMQRLSETIARQAIAIVDHDPDYCLLLALAAFEDCAPSRLAVRALTAALVAARAHAVLRGHSGWVRGVAWSPDGRRLATASNDQTIRIWDVVSSRELIVLHGHDNWVRAVAWSLDGQRLVTGSEDRTARIWDASTGLQLAVLIGHRGQVRDVAWSADGRRVATASTDRTARIWDPDTGRDLIVLHGHDQAVLAVAWSPGGWLATGSEDGTARIWETDNGRELTVLGGHDEGVRSVAWSPDGQHIATASYDHTARIWELRSGKERVTFRGHDHGLRHVAWSPDGKRVTTVSTDQTARIWDPDHGSEHVTLRGHNGTVGDVAWSPDGAVLATASHDWTARIWDPRGCLELAALYGHGDWVGAVEWSPDGRRLATGSGDKTARIWNAECESELLVLRGHGSHVAGVAWSPDGQRLATGSNDRTARIWNTDNGSSLVVLHGHTDELRKVAWSPDGKLLATGSRDQTIRIWDTDNGSELMVLHGHSDWIQGVAFSPNGRRLATASSDRTARIWDTANGRELMVLNGHDDWVWKVAWSPDGRRLATASGDRTARIWDSGSGREITVLGGHDGRVRGVAWSPDGRWLVTGSLDRTVRIWDPESGDEIIVIGAHAGGVESVSWSPDGARIASAAHDGTCRIWDSSITIEDLVAKARLRVSRELSADERRNLMLPSTGS